MRLGKVSFRNANAGNLEIFYKIPGQFAGNSVVVPGLETSPALEGTLLTMDLFINNTRYSADLTKYLPNGLWVEDESPYRVVGVVAKDGRHILHIDDNDGKQVDEFSLQEV